MNRIYSIIFLMIILGMSACSDSSTIGDPSTDGDLDALCPTGTEGCPCSDDGTCNDGLECRQNACRIIEPVSDGDLDTPDTDRSSEGEFDEVENSDSDSDLDSVNDGDLEDDSENGGFENDEDSIPDGDLDSESEERDADRVDSDPDTELEDDFENEMEPDTDPESEESVDEDQDPEEVELFECEDGPCCTEGQWLSVGSDCLQEVDDFSCTDDICDADHECIHPVQDGFCLIGETCFVHHENHPDNECQWCDSETNQWTLKPESETCDDSNPCTYDDHCDGGSCDGTPIVCEDGPGLCGTKRSCDGSDTCVVEVPDSTTPCESDEKDCTNDHCDGAGTCLHDRIETMCLIDDMCFNHSEWNPDDSCQKCDSESNNWVSREVNSYCEDGNPCTYYDECQEDGTCQTGEDVFACAPSECQETSVCARWTDCETTELPDGSPCGNDGLCTGPNTCQSGSCERTWAVDCKGHGVCIPDTGECDCLEGFAGTDCGECAPDAPGNYPNCAEVAGASPVTPTGQTACYGDGYVIPCSNQAGEESCGSTSYCGQDAEYPDPPRALRLVTISNDDVVIDSMSRLWWQASTSDSSTNWMGAIGYCSSLYYAGYSDWYLPLPRHWITLFDYGLYKAGLDPDLFPGNGPFWTTKAVVWDTGSDDSAWYVTTEADLRWSFNTDLTQYKARCVRNWTPGSEYGGDARFRSVNVPPDWIVDDLLTSLVWQVGTDSTPSGMTWTEALAYCENMSKGGFDNWRLPNIKELLSVVDYEHHDPASTFPSIQSDILWSSTSDPFDPRNSKVVDFATGQPLDSIKTALAKVKCVR